LPFPSKYFIIFIVYAAIAAAIKTAGLRSIGGVRYVPWCASVSTTAARYVSIVLGNLIVVITINRFIKVALGSIEP